MARILVVEDTLQDLELIRYLLHAAGHVVTASKNGTEAIAAMDFGSYDLILCDIELPGMDGFTLIRLMKSHPANACTPVIAVTFHVSIGDRYRVLRAGFDAYIPKPLDPELFLRQIGQILAAVGKQNRSGLFMSAIELCKQWTAAALQRC